MMGCRNRFAGPSIHPPSSYRSALPFLWASIKKGIHETKTGGSKSLIVVIVVDIKKFFY